MSGLVDSINATASSWAEFVVPWLWQATLLAVLALLVVRLGRRWSSPLRYGILLLALVKFALPPLWSLPTGVLALFDAPANAIAFAPEGTVQQASNVQSAVERTSVQRAAPARRRRPAALQMSALAVAIGDTHERRATLTTAAWLMLMHALGALFVLSWIAWHALALSRLLRRCRPAPAAVQDLLIEVAGGRSRRLPAVLVTPDGQGPAACGLVRRRILLPESTASLPPSRLGPVLAHELAHHERRDLWVALLQLVVAVFWCFNPAYWLLDAELRRVREQCCDDLTTARAGVDEQAYCATLLHTASIQAVSGRVLAASIGARAGLRARLTRLLDPSLTRPCRLGAQNTAVLVGLAAFVLPTFTGQASSDPGKVHVYSGRVLTPEGKPSQGAKVLLTHADLRHLRTPTISKRPVRAITEADGSFRFTVAAKDMPWGWWKRVQLVACKDGYGPAWLRQRDVLDKPVELRLVADGVPLVGRILDLEGRAVVGATVRAYELRRSDDDLDAWLSAVADKKLPMARCDRAVRERLHLDFAPMQRSTKGDERGEFRLSGFGENRIVHLVIEAPGIASTLVKVLTKKVDAFQAPLWNLTQTEPYYGAEFEIFATAPRRVVGRIVDEAGDPVSGVVVQSVRLASDTLRDSRYLITVSNKNGEYVLAGLPKIGSKRELFGRALDRSNSLIFYREGGLFLPQKVQFRAEPGLDDIEHDVTLRRGVKVRGRVLDRHGKPVAGARVHYAVDPKNPLRMAKRTSPTVMSWQMSQANDWFSAGWGPPLRSDWDGRFELTAWPGKGSVVARAASDWGNKLVDVRVDAKAPELTIRLDREAKRGSHNRRRR